MEDFKVIFVEKVMFKKATKELKNKLKYLNVKRIKTLKTIDIIKSFLLFVICKPNKWFIKVLMSNKKIYLGSPTA